jgi:hypothetical protein
MANAAEMVSIALQGTDNVSSAAKSAEASLNGLDAASKKVDTSFASVTGTVTKLAAAAGALAVTGVVAGFVAATGAAMDFEKQISAIAAVTGASQSDIAGLSQTALQLGKDTSFSASEAAVGMEELAKAGVSIADIMGGAGRASLDLAAAGAISVGDAAEIASNAMNVFGIEGTKMGHVADVIAGAANASAIGVNDYKFSLAAAGAVAATVGIGFEDLSTAIAVMGNAGIKGSDAGTSLKTMLLNLQPTTNKQIDLFRELGLMTTDTEAGYQNLVARGIQPAGKSYQDLSQAIKDHLGLNADISKWSKDDVKAFNDMELGTGLMSNAFFDAGGKAKDFAGIAQVLQDKLGNMTKAQQLATLEVMFGSDAIRAGAVLLDAGAEGFNNMAAAMDKVSARQVADERLNNLAGSIEKLKGSLETGAIILGSIFTGALKSMADSATETVNTIVGIIEILPGSFAGIVQAFEENGNIGSDALMGFSAVFGDFSDEVASALGMAGQAFDAFMSVVSPIAEFLADHTEVVIGFGAAILSLVGISVTVSAIGAVAAAIAFLVSPIGLVIAGIGLLTAAWVGNWGDIQGKTATAIQFVTGLIQSGMAAWEGFWTQHGEMITTIATAAWDFIVAGAMNAFTLLSGVFTASLQVISGDWAGAWTTITETAAAIWEGWGTQLGAVLTIIGALFAPTWTQITTETTTFLTGIQTEFDTQMAAIQGLVDAGLAAVTGFFQAGWDQIKAIQTAAWNLLTPENQQRIAEIQVLFTELWTMAGQIWTAGTTAITTIVTAWWTAKTTEATTMFNTLTTTTQTGWDAISAIWTTVTGLITTTVTEWWTKLTTQASEMMTALGAKIQELLAPWVEWFNTKFTEIGAAFTGAVTTLGKAASDLGTGIMTSLTGAITAKVNEVVDLVTGTVKSALEKAKSLLGSFQWGQGGSGQGPDDFNQYVQMSAKRQGISPEQALAVLGKEGPAGWGAEGHFDTGDSYGPLQLHYAGGPNPKEGMGDRFTRDTGIDLRTDKSMEAQKKAIDYALSQAAQKGDWSEWYGADNAFPGTGRFTPVKRVQPSTGADPAGIQMMNQTQQQWAQNANDANSICGPYLASLFTDAVGRPPSAAEAREIAASFGYGGPAGMLRNDQVDDMANAMISRFAPESGMRAVEQKMTDPAAASQLMQKALSSGSPLVGVNTRGHYYGADAYDPASGKFHVGGTGLSVQGGSDWLTVEQMTALMGPLQGIITLTGQGGAGFLTMGTDAQTMATTGQTANEALLLSTTTLSNGATVAITQMGNDVTTTIRDTSGAVTGQWTATVAGLVTGATTAQTGVNAAVDVMTANSLVSVNNMGTGIITSVNDMAGTNISTITDMNGQVTGLFGTLSDGTQVSMADMGTNVTSTVDTMSGNITTTMTTASGDVVTTTTDMAGKVLDQWVTLGNDVTTNQNATAAQIVQTEDATSADVRDINLKKNEELLKNQHDTGRGLIESVKTDTGVIVERWMLTGGDIETVVKDSNGKVVQDFLTSHANLIADSDKTHTQLLGKTTDSMGRTVEIYKEKTGEVVQIVTDSTGKVVEEYETTAQSAEDTMKAVEEFYGGLEEVPEVDLGDVVKEYDKARKAAEDYRKEADRAPDPSKGESGRDRVKSRQSGGRLDAGDLAWVGEGGRRELFISDRAGQIIAEHDLNYGLSGFGSSSIGDAAERVSRTMILQQSLNVQSSPEDMQRYTERAMRKMATEWGME